MIDINELRRMASRSIGITVSSPVSPAGLIELLDRLEAAEKERDALRVELNEIRYGVAVAHDTIKTLRDKIERMQKALSFYADETRYYGPNQRYEGGDPWTDAVGLRAYQLDVTRDRGHIARAALEESK